MTDLERIKKAIDWLIFMDVATSRKDLAVKLGYNESSLSQILTGKVNLSPKFVRSLASLDSRLSEDWMLTGDGELLKSNDSSCNMNINSGNAGRDITQQNGCATSDISSIIEKQTDILNQSLEQSKLAIDSIRGAIDEIAAQRKQMDRLINIIEKFCGSISNNEAE